LTYIDKYNTNKTWASCAYKVSQYDIATNRYYYSIFQKMLNKLYTEGISIDTSESEGTHNRTATIFREKILNKKIGKPTGKQKTRKIIEFNSNFQSLKKLRYIADYTVNSITEEQVNDVVKSFNVLDEIID